MIKRILVMSLLIVSIGSYAQEKKKAKSPEKHTALNNTFEKGQLDVNLGIGLLANRYYYFSGSRVSPPINLSIEKAVTENLSFGGYLAYIRSVYKNSGTYLHYDNNNAWVYLSYNDKVTVTYGVLGVRGAFHLAQYIQVENLDIYGGAMLGWSFANYKYTTDNSIGRVDPYYSSRGYGGLVAGFYLGARYRFTDKVGIFGELGYGLSYGNFGLNLKF